jgi:hypothetical protein
MIKYNLKITMIKNEGNRLPRARRCVDHLHTVSIKLILGSRRLSICYSIYRSPLLPKKTIFNFGISYSLDDHKLKHMSGIMQDPAKCSV